MVLCSGLWMTLKRKVMQKPKRNGIPNQRSRREKASFSANPARVLPESEILHPWELFKEFTYQEIATATNDFSPESLIGQGRFGAVYKGRLERIGQNVTIKKFDPHGQEGNREFLLERVMLAILCHENIAQLFGYCVEGGRIILVYAHMHLRSLEDHIHYFTSEEKALDWSIRMQIAVGVAKGLKYLHCVTNPPVIHSDLKTAHILLDHDFKPKISGFGLAKFGPVADMRFHDSTSLVTNGYWAPEYVNNGDELTLKYDIYSFGVVMLELITGCKPIEDSSLGPQRTLVERTLPLFKDDNMRKILDPKLIIENRGMEETVRKAVVLAFKCLREEPNARPTISQVVDALDDLVKFMAIEKRKSSQNG
ncbi:hypothetical protein BRARA_I00266 [Brassica rapa]|uniref:Protein kinase domain-containing protein n=1 Tax=Brassica campestris TaxID=3711 RepID=M4FDD0_BRACM|nr:hypothetical protein BRARA_I00266 [Brassica rapa]